ncbi:hypothetical protein EYF80_038624 [Liparis tanakae]|uniref:Uncharacterized protein n=1 Tax=Liparis tanakae TaxID=230148 RepID=A0A4Z2GEL1_9TELE|nr:hypothetical protein EYF80_038624 [Liparis tanakae]
MDELGRQGPPAAAPRWWFSLQRSQWGPAVLSLQPTQRPPLPVLRYCSASNSHWSDLPLQLHPVGEGRERERGRRGQDELPVVKKVSGSTSQRRGVLQENETGMFVSVSNRSPPEKSIETGNRATADARHRIAVCTETQN